MAFTVRQLRGRDSLHQAGEDLDSLLEATGAPFTARRPWLQSFADTHPGWEPWLVLVEDGQAVVAAAPLAQRRRAGVLEVTMLGHGPTDDARLPACSPGAASSLARAIRA